MVDYNSVAADYENWRRQQEAAQAQAMEQQRAAEEQQRAAQIAAQQQAQQQAAMQQAQQEQMRQAQMQTPQQIPALQSQGMQPQGMSQGMPQQTPNYAEMAKAIGLPWSPDDADYVQQINDYNARMQGLKQTAAERQATTDALRQQIAQNPQLLDVGKQNLANDRQLNNLADQLNSFYAKQNKVNQDEAQKAYTTAVLRTQIAQNPELFANAVKQFAAPTGKKKKGQATQKAQGQKGEYYSPSYVTEDNGTMPLGDLLRTDRAAVEELKKKLMQ